MYDGFDVREIRKKDRRRSLGIVFSGHYLFFTGTIADVISGSAKLDAGQEESKGRPKLPNADSFIRRLPQATRQW